MRGSGRVFRCLLLHSARRGARVSVPGDSARLTTVTQSIRGNRFQSRKARSTSAAPPHALRSLRYTSLQQRRNPRQSWKHHSTAPGTLLHPRGARAPGRGAADSKAPPGRVRAPRPAAAAATRITQQARAARAWLGHRNADRSEERACGAPGGVQASCSTRRSVVPAPPSSRFRGDALEAEAPGCQARPPFQLKAGALRLSGHAESAAAHPESMRRATACTASCTLAAAPRRLDETPRR
jgi:hypothetical protein